MWRALKPGGRIAAEMGGGGNVEIIHTNLIAALDRRGLDGAGASPWYFPPADEYRARLEKAGFDVSYIELIPRPTPLPGELADWLWTFGESFLLRVPETEQPAVIGEVIEAARPHLQKPGGNWVADYVRLRFSARKPGP